MSSYWLFILKTKKAYKMRISDWSVDVCSSDLHWVKPELVAEVAFAEFTAEGVVRHASFHGLREDKPAEDIVEETPQPVERAGDDDVKISNPGRVIFPESKITKGQLADYYRAVAPLMLAWTANRPVSLVRCPQGREIGRAHV